MTALPEGCLVALRPAGRARERFAPVCKPACPEPGP